MIKSILLGLLAGQIISSLQVYFSNLNLYRFLTAADSAGYLIIPSQNILPGLKTLGPAILGGLFFTLTTGAGLSILSYCLGWAWSHLLKRTPSFLIALVIIWSGLLFMFNMNGFSIFPSLYIIIIPAIVFRSTLKSNPSQGRTISRWSTIIHLSPVLILAFLWGREYDRSMLLDIRDNLLLTSAIGQKINDFYYKYTLYPAEAIKALEQKQLKGCTLKLDSDRGLRKPLEEALLNHDYLLLDSPEDVHLELHLTEESILFINYGKMVQRVTVSDFLADPEAALKSYSEKSDSHGLFRYATYFSLVGGFPLLLYLIVYSVLAGGIMVFSGSQGSGWAPSLICLVLGLMVLFFFQANRSPELAAGDLEKALQSTDWRQRTAALKLIAEKNLDIKQYGHYGAQPSSAVIAEKYWRARALGQSQRSSTVKDLLTLLDDSHPNVVCMALESLGKRGDRKTIPLVMKKLQNTNHWYIEWYAYRALRALGWKQKRSA